MRGLVINRFGGAGILLQTNGGNVIDGNYIGVDALATTARGNGAHGVQIDGTAGNTVGGVEPAARNVISGNAEWCGDFRAAATGNLVASNFIGTNGSGMSAIANSVNGVVINNASGNTIGTPDAGNVISGNVQNGIAILGGVVFGQPDLREQDRRERPVDRGDGEPSGRHPHRGCGVHGYRWRRAGAQRHRRQRPERHRHLQQHGRSGGPGTQIVGNTIGFRSPPNTVGNGLSGIHLGFATNTIIGGDTQDATNLISQNGRNGVTVLSGTGNQINGNNSIANNAILGIDLGNNGVTANDAGDGDAGPNNLQNFPVLTATRSGVHGHAEQPGEFAVHDPVLRATRPATRRATGKARRSSAQ